MAHASPQPQDPGSAGLALLSSLFAGGLVISAVLATKLTTIGPFTVPAGVLAFSLTFLCTDIAGEVYGARAARRVVWFGFAALIASLLLTQLALAMPPAVFWPHQAAFTSILSVSVRIIAASLVAYLVSQFVDVWLFHRIRAITGQKMLWLRNNVSTALAQLLDSVVFITLAFGGLFPIGELILGQWIIKMVIAALDTPLAYAGVALFQGHAFKNTSPASTP